MRSRQVIAAGIHDGIPPSRRICIDYDGTPGPALDRIDPLLCHRGDISSRYFVPHVAKKMALIVVGAPVRRTRVELGGSRDHLLVGPFDIERCRQLLRALPINCADLAQKRIGLNVGVDPRAEEVVSAPEKRFGFLLRP